MEAVFPAKAKKDLEYWKQSGDVKIMKRITRLLKDIEGIRSPFLEQSQQKIFLMVMM